MSEQKMNYIEAMEILEIKLSPDEYLEMKYLKKQYHRLALENHPDKNNNSIESKEKFQKINQSYELLKREISFINSTRTNMSYNNDFDLDLDDENEVDETTEENTNKTYYYILKTFIDNIIKENLKNYNINGYKDLIITIIEDIVSGCKNISIKLFENADKEVALYIYSFLSKYKNLLRISDEILLSVKEKITEKYVNDEIYIINPSIDDLLSNNIYILDIDREKYYVPLWHDIVYFDKKNSYETEVIVKCVPQLPSNMYINEDNELIVNIDISFTFSLMNKETITINIGKKLYEIKTNQLYLRRYQTYCFYGEGISEINNNDIYSTEKRGNIICNINFVE